MSAETASIPSPPPRPRPSATDWWLLGPGVSFPAAPNGTRSTTAPAKSVWAAAALALGTPEGAALAAALLDEPDWRHTYDEHLTPRRAPVHRLAGRVRPIVPRGPRRPPRHVRIHPRRRRRDATRGSVPPGRRPGPRHRRRARRRTETRTSPRSRSLPRPEPRGPDLDATRLRRRRRA